MLHLGACDDEGEACQCESKEKVEGDDFDGDGPDGFFGFFFDGFFHHPGHVGDGFDACQGEADFGEVDPHVGWGALAEVIEGDGFDASGQGGDGDDGHDS